MLIFGLRLVLLQNGEANGPKSVPKELCEGVKDLVCLRVSDHLDQGKNSCATMRKMRKRPNQCFIYKILISIFAHGPHFFA